MNKFKSFITVLIVLTIAIGLIGCSDGTSIEDVREEALALRVLVGEDGGGRINIDGQDEGISFESEYSLGREVELEAVADEDYQFEGWKSNVDGDIVEGMEEKITITMDEEKTFIAVFVVEDADDSRYTVIFKDYDDNVLKAEEVEYGSNATAPAEPTREGYEFTGWDVDFTNVTEDLTVRAQYEINIYTVRFEDYDGTELKTEEVDHGSNATAPESPEREGYEFTGWDVDFTNVTEDITVTALYVDEDATTYKVTFKDYNGDEIAERTVEKGSDASAPESPTREGYEFTGWDVDFTNVTEDLTVRAQYEINIYTVRFEDYDGTELKTEEVEYGSNGTAPESPEREGYEFTGWDVDFTNVTEDLTVRAQYEINIYTVRFEDYDGTELKTEEVEYGSNGTAPAEPTREGYEFTGWDVDFTNVTEDLTVRAQYEINIYTVRFEDYDGTELKTEEVDHGSNATAPESPEREGYEFTGWDVDFTNVTDDIIVTALYVDEDATTYKVTFKDYNGDEIAERIVEKGSDASAPESPEREGYEFTGWDVEFTNVTEDLTVRAQYEINIYTVRFEDYDGTELKTEEVEYGSNATAPESPEREGYKFTGWDVDFTDVTEDIIVTAQYEAAPEEGDLTVGITIPFVEEVTELSVSVDENSNYVTVTWEHSSDDIVGYYVYRSSDYDVDNAERVSGFINEENFTDQSGEAGDYYWIIAYNQDGYSSGLVGGVEAK